MTCSWKCFWFLMILTATWRDVTMSTANTTCKALVRLPGQQGIAARRHSARLPTLLSQERRPRYSPTSNVVAKPT